MSKGLIFDADDKFPFDKLRVGSRGEGCTISDFGIVRQKTYLEVQPGVYEDFEIQFSNNSQMAGPFMTKYEKVLFEQVSKMKEMDRSLIVYDRYKSPMDKYY